jgi:oligoribonuclease NrnB/cAMP/cGMP phosphodiesterase (DHH superfamily)
MYKPDICIYHGNCDDGFGAAWAIWKRWPDTEFVAGVYGEDPPNGRCNDKRVLMVDFSYKKPVLDKLLSFARDITIIDHHKTAQAELETFAIFNPVSAKDIDEVLAATQPGLGPIRAWFDMNQSGAAMAYQFAMDVGRSQLPDFIQIIEDRDLWRFKFGERTKQFSAALRTYPMNFDIWGGLATRSKVEAMYREGSWILQAHRANIEKFLAETYTETIGGFVVPVVNVPYHYASDTAHAMLEKNPLAPFTACWFRRADGMIQYSLRSEDSREDVSEIAKKFGGGGHRNAAGFQVKA